MTPKVPISDIGTATLAMSVARTLRRNAKTTRITSRTETRSVSSTSRSDARIVVVRSRTTESLIAVGMAAASCVTWPRTRSTVSMMFAAGCRNTTSSTAGLPSTSPAARRSSTESWTLATSDSLTAAPAR